MQWEIVVMVILAIGICTAVMEARQKRAARKEETKETETERRAAKEAAKEQNTWI